MRLIDADALAARLENECREWEGESAYQAGLCAAAVIVAEAPTLKQEPTIGGWISVQDRIPEEHPSIFAGLYGTGKWAKGMWRNESDRVLVTIVFPDGTRTVDKGRLQDGTWKTGVSPILPQEVTHWAMFPEPPELPEVEA